MEAVSAVKMRKSQQVALTARPYAVSALRLLRNLHSSMPEDSGGLSPLLDKREVRNTLLIVVTSDKGLAGSFNTNVLKKAESYIKTTLGNVHVATVGKKAGDYFTKRGRKPLIALTGFGDFADIAEVEPIFTPTVQAFKSTNVDEVFVIYTNFLSAIKQEVVIRKILPFSEEGLEEMVNGIVPERGRFAEASVEVRPQQKGALTSTECLFEPSPKEIFDSILPALLRIQIYHAILEANASEHSSRMVAMRNATDNATDLIKSYTVSMNKARQSAINKELAEISGGAEALTA